MVDPIEPAPKTGSYSATSILQVVLHVSRVISWVVLVISGIWIFFTSLSTVFGGDGSSGDIIGGLRTFLSAGLIIHIAGYLLSILHTIKEKSPFQKENAFRLRTIARAVMVVELVKIGIGIIGGLFLGLESDSEYDLLDMAVPFLAAAIAYTLAAVFEEGARLKEEQDYTI